MPTSIPPTYATYRLLKPLNTPARIQDFLNALPFNFERQGETCRSVEDAIAAGEAHCFEGALIAAAALQLHGQRPLLLDLKSASSDLDHVVAVFERRISGKSYWGAVSKTNHAVLRFREPVYTSVRELAMSYFHEYFLNDGRKTLRSYSRPFDLSRVKYDWISAGHDLSDLAEALDHSPHLSIVPKGLRLRPADPVEIKAGEIMEWEQ